MIRELVLPYVVLMAAIAFFEDRRREALAWAAVVVAFFAYLGVHAAIVSPLIQPGDGQNQWVAMGGWRFILDMASWNGLLVLSPTWTIALFVPVSLLGLLEWNTPLGRRTAATLALYLACFIVVGRPDNVYWE